MDTSGLLLLLLAIVLNAMANILMKASALHRMEGLQDQLFNPWMISGLACFGLAFLAYRQVLLRGLPLSVAYPVMTTAGFVIVLAASNLFFRERLDLIQWGGIALLLAGIWMIAGRIA